MIGHPLILGHNNLWNLVMDGNKTVIKIKVGCFRTLQSNNKELPVRKIDRVMFRRAKSSPSMVYNYTPLTTCIFLADKCQGKPLADLMEAQSHAR